MSINAQNRSLPDWFTRVRTRQLVLPRFQRFEVWPHTSVAALFNTVLQGLPVGAVLVLEIGNEQPFISRTLEGAPTDGERITEHLLDGQQRLTGLWRALHNNYEDRTYFVYLTPDEETNMPYFVASVARWKKPGDKEFRPFWASSPTEQWNRRMIPLDLCASGDEAQSRFKSWAHIAIPNPEEREEIAEIRSAIRQAFATFNLPFLSLPVSTSKETALDVFIKMNSSATPLSTYDIVVAQVEAGMGKSLHDLVAAVKSDCSIISEYYSPEDLVLYASALLQSRAPINSTYLAKDFGQRLLDNWDILVRGIERAATFLNEELIFDAARLPTDVVVPVLSALWALAPDGLDAEGRARVIMRKYIWRAFFSNRYEKSTSTRALSDFTELKPLVMGTGVTKPVIFDSEEYPLPQVQELLDAAWPKQKDRLARAILAVSLRQGGLDLADGSKISRANLSQREYHHIFPDAYLRRLGVGEQRIYRSLNCALVTWKTNRNISDKEPEQYLAQRRDGTEVGDTELRIRLESHLIPFNEITVGDYERFLNARADLIHDKMNALCA